MTLLQAATIAVTNKLHIRRESWPAEKWLWKKGETPFGPGWMVFYTATGTVRERNGTQPTRGGTPTAPPDVTSDDMIATDWTTVPAALMSCPITPTEPIGGSTPTPGVGAFPTAPTTFPPTRGVPSGGGPTAFPPLPTPTPGTVVTVDFSGIHDQDDQDPMALGYVAHLNLNRPIVFGPRGGTVHFQSGYQPNEPDDDSGNQDVLNWTATAEVSGGLWTVTLVNDENPIWGRFQTAESKKAGDTIFNAITEGSFIRGGQAVVSIG